MQQIAALGAKPKKLPRKMFLTTSRHDYKQFVPSSSRKELFVGGLFILQTM